MALFARAFLAAFIGSTLDKPEHFSYGEDVGVAGKQIAAIGAAAGFNEATLFEAGEDQFEKFLGDGLASRDLGDFDGLAGRLAGQVEDCAQGVLAFNRDVQPKFSSRCRPADAQVEGSPTRRREYHGRDT